LLADHTLGDGEFLIVWLEGDTSRGPTHAGFVMPSKGGNLYLFSSGSDPIDVAEVAGVPAGRSQVRMGLYGRSWEVTVEPTPGAANRLTVPPVSPGTGRLVVNEIMADNDAAFADPDEPDAFEDWFEIYNPGSEAVDMTGMYITDNPNNPTKWKVGDGVVIPSGGYLVFMADSEPSQGPRHASWALSADGESVSLYDKDGRTLIDSVTFGPQATDVSYGRVPDGTGAWQMLAGATPGAANSGPR
jgi:hypothetical protein